MAALSELLTAPPGAPKKPKGRAVYNSPTARQTCLHERVPPNCRIDQRQNSPTDSHEVPKFKMATDAILSAKMKVNFNANSRLPPAGSTLMRNYRGKEIVVFVLPKGFEYEGQIYRTISGVVKAITGTKWNGYEFFGLK